MRLPGKCILILLVTSCFCVGPEPLCAQETSLISFELKDQFDRVHRDSDYADGIVIVIGSDGDGSEFNPVWGDAIHSALQDHPRFERIAFLPVAHLTGVPFFIKGMVRGRFPEDPDQWVLMDWEGAFDRAYGFVPGSANILLFAPGGKLVTHAYGQELDPDVLQGIVSSARALLSSEGQSYLRRDRNGGALYGEAGSRLGRCLHCRNDDCA